MDHITKEEAHHLLQTIFLKVTSSGRTSKAIGYAVSQTMISQKASKISSKIESNITTQIKLKLLHVIHRLQDGSRYHPSQ